MPYRTLAHPPISVWEQKVAVARLREQGWAEVDEAALFQTVAKMRAITDTAVRGSRRAGRDTARRSAASAPTARSAAAGRPPASGTVTVVDAFDVEEW
jgi:putative transposase